MLRPSPYLWRLLLLLIYLCPIFPASASERQDRAPWVQETGEQGLSALHLAAAYGLPHWTQTLLAQGATVTFDQSGWSPLHLAARHGHCATLAILLKAQPQLINQASLNQGQTPLHLAIMHGQTQAVGCLLSHGAQADQRDANGVAPVLLAVLLADEAILEQMRVAGFPVNTWLQQRHPEGRSWLQVLAAWPDMADPLQLLVRRGVSLQAHSGDPTALVLALSAGHFDNVQALLEVGAQVNNAAEAASLWQELEKHLHESQLQHPTHRQLLAQLLRSILRYQNVMAPSDLDESLLNRRILEGDVLAVDFLLDFAPELEKPNAQQLTPLMLALSQPARQQRQLVARLLQAGAQVNVQDAQGNTPLHLAVQAGQPELVRLLLPYVHALTANQEGQTPLDLARMQGDAELIEELRPLYIRNLFQ